MAENIPPNGGNADATRGLPYYEKLKRDLRETLQKKRLLDKNMGALEEQIYRFEGSYLEETAAGNIIKGFDNYIKGSTAAASSGPTGGGTASRRKGGPVDQERVFSRSSVSFNRETSPQSSTQTTPSHVPTPTSSGEGGRTAAYSSNAAATKGEKDQPTPTSATSRGGSSNKRNKKGPDKDKDKEKEKEKEEEGESDSKPPKRMKISYSRAEKGND